MAFGRALMRRSPSTAVRDRKTRLSDDAGEGSDATCQRRPNKFGEAVSGKGVEGGEGRLQRKREGDKAVIARRIQGSRYAKPRHVQICLVLRRYEQRISQL